MIGSSGDRRAHKQDSATTMDSSTSWSDGPAIRATGAGSGGPIVASRQLAGCFTARAATREHEPAVPHCRLRRMSLADCPSQVRRAGDDQALGGMASWRSRSSAPWDCGLGQPHYARSSWMLAVRSRALSSASNPRSTTAASPRRRLRPQSTRRSASIVLGLDLHHALLFLTQLSMPRRSVDPNLGHDPGETHRRGKLRRAR
jgi:hypothetical protein